MEKSILIVKDEGCSNGAYNPYNELSRISMLTHWYTDQGKVCHSGHSRRAKEKIRQRVPDSRKVRPRPIDSHNGSSRALIRLKSNNRQANRIEIHRIHNRQLQIHILKSVRSVLKPSDIEKFSKTLLNKIINTGRSIPIPLANATTRIDGTVS